MPCKQLLLNTAKKAGQGEGLVNSGAVKQLPLDMNLKVPQKLGILLKQGPALTC